jgi:hypothetical protein
MKIRLLQPYMRFKVGTILDYPELRAKQMVADKHAELVEDEPKAKRAKAPRNKAVPEA